MVRRSRNLALAVGVAALALALAVPPVSAQQNLPRVSGAGSTWSQNAVDQWRADVNRFGLQVDFSGIGSTAGRQRYIQGQVDFAVTEIPFLPEEQDAANRRPFVYLPIVAGGTSIMYNVRDGSGAQVRNLRLSPRTLAGIFTGAIRRWSDDAIAADNGGRRLPDNEIIVVYRSDGSGTSAQFTAALNALAPDIWQPFARRVNARLPAESNFPGAALPQNSGATGSDGVANRVADGTTGQNTITYVETSYALERRMPVASVLNASGNYVQPTPANTAKALELATINTDRTQVLDRVYTNPAPSAYPISSYSYMVAPTFRDLDPRRGEAIARFIYYFVCAGQQKAAPLGYSPLPPNLVRAALEAAVQIPGAPRPPAVNAQECRNPTVTNTGGGTVGGGGTGGGGTTATTTAGNRGQGGTTGGTSGSGGGGTGPGGGTGSGAVAGGAATDDAVAGEGTAIDPATGEVVDDGALAEGGASGDGAQQAVAPVVEVSQEIPLWPFLLVAGFVLLLVLVPPIIGGVRLIPARARADAPSPSGDPGGGTTSELPAPPPPSPS